MDKYKKIDFLCLIVVFVIISFDGDVQQSESPSLQVEQHLFEFQNGKWFNGTDFVDRTFYSDNGLLRSTRPAQVL